MGKIARKILIRQANCKDADAIYQIGKVCFTDAWRKETVIHDLTENQTGTWWRKEKGELLDMDVFGLCLMKDSL